MTEGDSSTVDVDLGGIYVHDLFGSANDNAKGLVEFEERDVILRNTSLLQSLGNGDGGSSREVHRVGSSVGIGCMIQQQKVQLILFTKYARSEYSLSYPESLPEA